MSGMYLLACPSRAEAATIPGAPLVCYTGLALNGRLRAKQGVSPCTS